MIETNAISDSDGKTISYSYENGRRFTNTFEDGFALVDSVSDASLI